MESLLLVELYCSNLSSAPGGFDSALYMAVGLKGPQLQSTQTTHTHDSKPLLRVIGGLFHDPADSICTNLAGQSCPES
ncbi:hypothetical protein SAMN02745181_3897 [Rubritalea squalenifaciens DSM 18772]|uniref:Uncharacterized protein n=1 Tax=Rubritalea squalenifaciens DSM 18772 TaxID=1123071 RepID=A0A1M6SU75_9BACT|nr:hypothetical protein SAMN02745181_3897 [Rubritalea squalenifaciens DSM 18772]